MENKNIIETLEEQFEKFIAWNIEGDPKATEFTINDMYKAFIEAREINKEQLKHAYYSGYDEIEYPGKPFEQYYNETYNE